MIWPPAAGEVYYRGHGSAKLGSGARLVTVEQDGQVLGLLRHVVRHSPTGMTWGYGGSGPADLARSLLIDALGDQAKCGTCAGGGQLALSHTGGQDLVEPYDPIRHSPVDDGDGSRWELTGCWDCDGGLVHLPYQQFKFDVVAGLPDPGWVLTRQQLLGWYNAHADKAG